MTQAGLYGLDIHACFDKCSRMMMSQVMKSVIDANIPPDASPRLSEVSGSSIPPLGVTKRYPVRLSRRSLNSAESSLNSSTNSVGLPENALIAQVLPSDASREARTTILFNLQVMERVDDIVLCRQVFPPSFMKLHSSLTPP